MLPRQRWLGLLGREWLIITFYLLHDRESVADDSFILFQPRNGSCSQGLGPHYCCWGGCCVQLLRVGFLRLGRTDNLVDTYGQDSSFTGVIRILGNGQLKYWD